MAELPTGTVTFLFTDVEGSTRLLQELGDAYVDVLAEHRRALRDAFARHGGVEVDTQGDAFFVAFATATDALAAAAEACDALASGPIRVRMGLHTGEPLLTNEGYVGIDVHRAARIAAAGHGGQVLVSQSTCDLVGVGGLRELGKYRLKDLTAPERIYQLGDEHFAPLKSLNESKLPIAANPLVGRARELRELQEMLRDSARLVTLTGTGGSGKTRLGLQVAAELADDFAGGVFFVPLAGIRQADLVESTVSAAIGAQRPEDIRDREALVVVDNFEHVLEAAPAVGAFLSAGPNIKILVTSRAPLRVAGEREYPVQPLNRNDAVEFLTQRGRAVRPDFEPDAAAEEICVRLDGLPLALELAASRLRSLGSEGLLQRLDQRLPVLTAGRRDAPERQRTLRATIEWSYDLLSDRLQAIFARLAVFAGPFSLEAAEIVADASYEEVDGLVEASLLKPVRGDRFLMLETIKEYAAERLAASGLEEELRSRHAEYFLEVATDANTKLKTSGQTAALARLRAEQDNLRAALGFFERIQAAEKLLGLTVALGRFWYMSAATEGVAWLERARRHAKPDNVELWAESASALATLHLVAGQVAQAPELLEEALAGFQSTGNLSRAAEIMSDQGFWAYLSGDVESAAARFEEVRHIAATIDDRWVFALGTSNLVEPALEVDDFDRALKLSLEASDLFHQVGDTWAGTRCLYYVGLSEFLAGRLDDAHVHLKQSLDVTDEIPLTETAALSLALLASIAVARGSLHLAAGLLGCVERICQTTGLTLQRFPGGIRDRTVADLLARMGQDELEDAWARGRAMELDEAVRYALDWIE